MTLCRGQLWGDEHADWEELEKGLLAERMTSRRAP